MTRRCLARCVCLARRAMCRQGMHDSELSVRRPTELPDGRWSSRRAASCLVERRSCAHHSFELANGGGSVRSRALRCDAGRRKHSIRSEAHHRRSVFEDGTGSSVKEARRTARRPAHRLLPPVERAAADTSTPVKLTTTTTTTKLEAWRESQLRRGVVPAAASIPGVSDAGDASLWLVATASQAKRGALWAGVDESPGDATAPVTPSSIPVRRLSRKDDLVRAAGSEREARAVVVVQSAARGRLTRRFKLAGVAAHEQQAAVDSLRARRHLADAGRGNAVLPPAQRVVLDGKRSQRTKVVVHC